MIIKIDTTGVTRYMTFVSSHTPKETLEKWRDEDLADDLSNLKKFLISKIESDNFIIVDEEEYGPETKRINSFWEYAIKLSEDR